MKALFLSLVFLLGFLAYALITSSQFSENRFKQYQSEESLTTKLEVLTEAFIWSLPAGAQEKKASEEFRTLIENENENQHHVIAAYRRAILSKRNFLSRSFLEEELRGIDKKLNLQSTENYALASIWVEFSVAMSFIFFCLFSGLLCFKGFSPAGRLDLRRGIPLLGLSLVSLMSWVYAMKYL